MKKLTSSFGTGAIALAFAVLGYQTALLVHHSATARIIANRDAPDTVYIEVGGGGPDENPHNGSPDEDRYGGGSCQNPSGDTGHGGYSKGATASRKVRRHNSPHSQKAQQVRRKMPTRKVENFPFDPNTCPEEDFIRLGFSEKQARSIINYRSKGGRFRRKTDFAKSYVVSDSVYARLEPYIDIPRIDLNKADSAAFDLLPGIGGWYARKMVEHRGRLGGYSYPEQLMDIKGLDEEKYGALQDLICIEVPYRLPLWTLPEDSLARHPYIRGRQAARSIVFYREHNPPRKWTVEGLLGAGIITGEQAGKLSRCIDSEENGWKRDN